MSSINSKYRRKLAIQTFKGRGRHAVPVNDCKRPSLGEGTKADLLEVHQEKMKHKRLRKVATRLSTALSNMSPEQRRLVLHNFSRDPKGHHPKGTRTRAPRFSIWPERRELGAR